MVVPLFSNPFPLVHLLLATNLRQLFLAAPHGRIRGVARRALNLEEAPQEKTWDEVRKITSIYKVTLVNENLGWVDNNINLTTKE